MIKPKNSPEKLKNLSTSLRAPDEGILAPPTGGVFQKFSMTGDILTKLLTHL